MKWLRARVSAKLGAMIAAAGTAVVVALTDTWWVQVLLYLLLALLLSLVLALFLEKNTAGRAQAVLDVMSRDPLAGWWSLDLAKEIGIASGSIYPTLALLERAGMLESCWVTGEGKASRRRLYSLTAKARGM